jgi:hypothetical protein
MNNHQRYPSMSAIGGDLGGCASDGILLRGPAGGAGREGGGVLKRKWVRDGVVEA